MASVQSDLSPQTTGKHRRRAALTHRRVPIVAVWRNKSAANPRRRPQGALRGRHCCRHAAVQSLLSCLAVLAFISCSAFGQSWMRLGWTGAGCGRSTVAATLTPAESTLPSTTAEFITRHSLGVSSDGLTATRSSGGASVCAPSRFGSVGRAHRPSTCPFLLCSVLVLIILLYYCG